jgi:hypothetical protein
LIANCLATLKLPFVYAGVARDFWSGFEERYFCADRGYRSTFFAIPARDYAGRLREGTAPKRRAARYGAAEIRDVLQKIIAKGCEVGLHGIDAWHNPDSAQKELNELRQSTNHVAIGVRMHWLFFDEHSPKVLENAGASYDSTIGYRETVGFRTGTSQVYRPLGAETLLELPLHVMDTALFYPAYLGHSQREAESHVREIIAKVAEYGGCLTVNWHDRSLAPERNWESCYRAILDELAARNAWFATAGEVASWFRMRRSVAFESIVTSPQQARAKFPGQVGDKLPGLSLRIHGSRQQLKRAGAETGRYVDLPIEREMERREAVNS